MKEQDALSPSVEAPEAAEPCLSIDDALEVIGFGRFQTSLLFLCGMGYGSYSPFVVSFHLGLGTHVCLRTCVVATV
jgi:hypothetical protein